MRPRQKIALSPDQDQMLRRLYLELGIPSDQYPRRPAELRKLMRTWRALTGRNDRSGDVLHYIVTRRKKGQWVRFDGKHERMPHEGDLVFSHEDWEQLDAIYEELQIASDTFALDAGLAKKVRDEFAERTGRIVPALQLCGAMIRRRKAGKLATLKPRRTDEDLEFQDVDEIGA